MNAPASPPQRIVIYRLGSLGDTVVALPCLHRIAASFPQAERIMLTNVPVSSKAAPLEAILGGSGLVHRFMAYPVGTRSLGALQALRSALRALDAQTLIYLTPNRGGSAAWRDLIFFKLCGFRRVIGAPLRTDLLQNRRAPDGTIEPECERMARCISELGPITLDDPAAWDLHLTKHEKQQASQALEAAGNRPRIAINMGGKVAENDWGEPNWLSLIDRLKTLCPDHALVFVGALEDASRAQQVANRWGGTSINLCGRVPPRVSAAAMEGSRCFVGHDSGPLHLASSRGVTCVGLYGNKNEPRKWHPFGAHHRIIHDMHGVLAITVDRVFREIEDELAHPQNAGGRHASATLGSEAP